MYCVLGLRLEGDKETKETRSALLVYLTPVVRCNNKFGVEAPSCTVSACTSQYRAPAQGKKVVEPRSLFAAYITVSCCTAVLSDELTAMFLAKFLQKKTNYYVRSS